MSIALIFSAMFFLALWVSVFFSVSTLTDTETSFSFFVAIVVQSRSQFL